jgi:hypothetical protein
MLSDSITENAELRADFCMIYFLTFIEGIKDAATTCMLGHMWQLTSTKKVADSVVT